MCVCVCRCGDYPLLSCPLETTKKVEKNETTNTQDEKAVVVDLIHQMKEQPNPYM